MNLITFQRTWLRPWAFYQLEDKKLRDELLALFPDGCYVGVRGRHLLRGAQREHGRSLARAACACRVMGRAGVRRWAMRSSPCRSASIRFPTSRSKLTSTAFRRFTPIAKFSILTRCNPPPPSPGRIILRARNLDNRWPQDFFSRRPAQIPPDLAQHAANLMGPVAQFLDRRVSRAVWRRDGQYMRPRPAIPWRAIRRWGALAWFGGG